LFIVLLLVSVPTNSKTVMDYREEMRDLVQSVSRYTKTVKQGFMIVPQNGESLITINDDPKSPPHKAYISAIDGQAREDLIFGYEKDDVPTIKSIQSRMFDYLDTLNQFKKTILVTDYCKTKRHIRHAFRQNKKHGFISFAAPNRSLDSIPSYPRKPRRKNKRSVTQLNQVQNFLYLLDYHLFETKESLLAALSETRYDLFIIDLFYNNRIFEKKELDRLKLKPTGGRRLILCYMSIGEAETYRYYWQNQWLENRPHWLLSENPNWEGNYKVKYWSKDWQRILYGSPNAYADRAIKAGCDGLYLDIIDAFEYFSDLVHK